ncbi:hypothetical protein [Nocardia sp. CNY236]|uniref:hypothetical protein n=1 Tax=Nocardia sp. CNY236 TaxID=1169152 RepID=UPI00048E674D|nr:hypothetical protein [Nocardia sp. CNY236]
MTVYFHFLELRHNVEPRNLNGRVVECPLDEINRPRASVDPQLRSRRRSSEREELDALRDTVDQVNALVSAV